MHPALAVKFHLGVPYLVPYVKGVGDAGKCLSEFVNPLLDQKKRSPRLP